MMVEPSAERVAALRAVQWAVAKVDWWEMRLAGWLAAQLARMWAYMWGCAWVVQ